MTTIPDSFATDWWGLAILVFCCLIAAWTALFDKGKQR